MSYRVRTDVVRLSPLIVPQTIPFVHLGNDTIFSFGSRSRTYIKGVSATDPKSVVLPLYYPEILLAENGGIQPPTLSRSRFQNDFLVHSDTLHCSVCGIRTHVKVFYTYLVPKTSPRPL